MNIGEYVRREKEARGMTLDQLYKLTGIRAGHLSRLITRPPRTPDIYTVEKLAAAFVVHPSEIWAAISIGEAAPELSLEQRLFARVGCYLQNMPGESQERAMQVLESTARGLADLALGPSTAGKIVQNGAGNRRDNAVIYRCFGRIARRHKLGCFADSIILGRFPIPAV